jgi:hypothetical protein
MRKDSGQVQAYLKEVNSLENEKPGNIMETGLVSVWNELQSVFKDYEAQDFADGQRKN